MLNLGKKHTVEPTQNTVDPAWLHGLLRDKFVWLGLAV